MNRCPACNDIAQYGAPCNVCNPEGYSIYQETINPMPRESLAEKLQQYHDERHNFTPTGPGIECEPLEIDSTGPITRKFFAKEMRRKDEQLKVVKEGLEFLLKCHKDFNDPQSSEEAEIITEYLIKVEELDNE